MIDNDEHTYLIWDIREKKWWGDDLGLCLTDDIRQAYEWRDYRTAETIQLNVKSPVAVVEWF